MCQLSILFSNQLYEKGDEEIRKMVVVAYLKLNLDISLMKHMKCLFRI